MVREMIASHKPQRETEQRARQVPPLIRGLLPTYPFYQQRGLQLAAWWGGVMWCVWCIPVMYVTVSRHCITLHRMSYVGLISIFWINSCQKKDAITYSASHLVTQVTVQTREGLDGRWRQLVQQ